MFQRKTDRLVQSRNELLKERETESNKTRKEDRKLGMRKNRTDLPAFVTIISVPSSLNSSQRGFISRAAPVLSSLGCTGRAHLFLPAAASCIVSVAMLLSSAPLAAVFPPG